MIPLDRSATTRTPKTRGWHQLKRSKPYQPLERNTRTKYGHSCCADHVVQTAVLIALVVAVDDDQSTDSKHKQAAGITRGQVDAHVAI